MLRRQWRDWAVPAAALLVLASGFLPWYGLRLVTRSDAGEGVERRYVSAWAASTLWSAAVIVSVAAAAGWLAWRLRHGEVPLAGRLGLALLPGAALAMIARQWRGRGDFHQVYSRPKTTVSLHAASDKVPWPEVARDHLLVLHGDAISMDVRWGAYVAVAGILLLAVALVAGGRFRN